jgi:hypothetical protein
MTEPTSVTKEILSLLEYWEPRLKSLPEGTLTQFCNSQNRTIKQILGHLIDSTSNNIHRIIHLQYQQSPLIFPNYATFGNNDKWIAIQDYQSEDWETMICLWKCSLLHLCHVITKADPSRLENIWISGPDKTITLREMILDFPRHLKLHLTEISDLINKK